MLGPYSYSESGIISQQADKALPYYWCYSSSTNKLFLSKQRGEGLTPPELCIQNTSSGLWADTTEPSLQTVLNTQGAII